MSRKRKLNADELEKFADMSDSEWDEFLKDNSDEDRDYVVSSDQSSSSDEDNENNVPQTVHIEEAETSMDSNTGPGADEEWCDIEEEPPMFDFLPQKVGLNIQGELTVEYLVNLFFSEIFFNIVAQQTNLYANQEIQKTPVTRSSRKKRWVETNANEMRVFLGTLLHMGPCTFPTIEHYWSQNIMYKMPFWGQVIIRNRFQLLLRFLHFADNSLNATTEDRLFKIRPVLNHFNKLMQEQYVPNKHLCIDESMVLWRGRLFFRQYIKNKKHKYGAKLYELCESNGMVLKIKVYCGKSEVTESANGFGHASNVVLHLMESYLDKGYVLFTDNFYNSVSLTHMMTSRKTYICGTLRANRKKILNM